MTAINAAGDWDDSHEVIVHWLLIPLSNEVRGQSVKVGGKS